MDIRSSLAPQSVWGDGIVIGGCLAVANYAIAPVDPGWLNLNPTPYLLLPVLLGARYGFGPGVIVGVIVAVLVSVVRVVLGFSADITTELYSHGFLWAALVASGGIAGELWLYFRKRVEQLKKSEESLRGKLRQLDSDVLILREAKDELDRISAARDGEISSLDAELRRLYACSAAELPEAILSLLKRQARVTDAAIYRVPHDWDDEDQEAHRIGLTGSDAKLPEQFALNSDEMVKNCLRAGGLVTLPEVLRDEPAVPEHFLLAAPLLSTAGQPIALLIVADMPFIAFNPSTVDLIDMVCGWSGGVLEISEGAEGRYRLVADRVGQKIFFDEQFVHLVELAFESCRRHRLPSAVVELALPNEPLLRQSEFEKIVLGAVRAGDFVTQPETDFPSLRVLLPLAGERGTDIFIDRCTQFCLRQGVEKEALRVRRVDLAACRSAADALNKFSGESENA
ncbi:MAG: hypothetical protein SynsKO_39530 [Synoicihabitans sp.]